MTILEIELPLLMSTQLGQPTLTTDSNLQWTNNNKNQIEKSDDQGSEENQNSSTAPGGGSINREFLTIDTSSRKGRINRHLHDYPDKPMRFTKNEVRFQSWGIVVAIRDAFDIVYSVTEWFAGSGTIIMYADDVCFHADEVIRGQSGVWITTPVHLNL
ncbi:unnamed protein product [Rotaria sp. Silwood1]|nr:unnamed protein product [Rotaria sp. Silwood1]